MCSRFSRLMGHLSILLLLSCFPKIHSLPSKNSQVNPSSSKLIKSQHFGNKKQLIPTKTTITCPNGLQDGEYIFRSTSEEDWSFCGVSGSGFDEFHFQIKDCECLAGTSGKVCASVVPDGEPTFHSSHSPLIGSAISPVEFPPLFSAPDLHCSNDDYSISPTDTCLLVTLSDQFGDGWTSGDGSSENAWFGYSFSSSYDADADDVTTSPILHSLSCSCPRKIGCITPSSSSLPSGDQLISLAIYSNAAEDRDEDIPVAFSWEIMYLVQVIQNGRLVDSYYGGYRTQMEFSYTHSTGTLTLSSKMVL
jgi:hypothetical protein